MGAPWFYFGCNLTSGHYLFDQNGQKTQHWGDPALRTLKDALSHFDGVLPPLSRDKFVAPLYVASFSTLGGLGYCALSWWDCSVDKRPSSNSTVFAPGLDWSPVALLSTAPLKMPWVFARLPKPLLLCPAESAASSPSGASAGTPATDAPNPSSNTTHDRSEAS